MAGLKQLWATVHVEIVALGGTKGKKHFVRVVDSCSLELHSSEQKARKYVAQEIREGSEIMALFQLNSLYAAGEIEIVPVEAP